MFEQQLTKIFILSSAFSRTFCVLWDETAVRNEHLFLCSTQQWDLQSPKSVKTVSQTIQTIFQTKDTEWYFQLSKAMPFACWNFFLSYPFSHQAVKGWLLSVFCTLHHRSGHSLGWNHPRISETIHLLWPLAIWTYLITLFQFAGLPFRLSGQDPSFPQLLKSQASNLGGS